MAEANDTGDDSVVLRFSGDFDDRGLATEGASGKYRLFEVDGALGEKLVSGNTTDVAPTVTKLVSRIKIGRDQVKLLLSRPELCSVLNTPGECPSGTAELTVNFCFKRYGQETKLIVHGANGEPEPRADPALIKAIVRAHDWFDRLCSGQTPTEIADAAGVGASFITRIIRLAFLAPDITQAIIDGTQPASLSADYLVQRSGELPIDWDRQRAALGVES